MSEEDAAWLRARIDALGMPESAYLRRVVERAVVKMRENPDALAVWETEADPRTDPDGTSSPSTRKPGRGSTTSLPDEEPPSPTSDGGSPRTPSPAPSTTPGAGKDRQGVTVTSPASSPSSTATASHRHKPKPKGEPFGSGGQMWQARECECGQQFEAVRL